MTIVWSLGTRAHLVAVAYKVLLAQAVKRVTLGHAEIKENKDLSADV